jgi:hypothetical protein
LIVGTNWRRRQICLNNFFRHRFILKFKQVDDFL